MKLLLAFLLASLIPSASFQPSDDDGTPGYLDVLLPNIPVLITNLTKLSEDANNGLPIDQSTLNGVNEGLTDISAKLGDLYDDSQLPFIPSSERKWLVSQITNIRNAAAKLPINPIDELQYEGVDVNNAFDNTIYMVNALTNH